MAHSFTKGITFQGTHPKKETYKSFSPREKAIVDLVTETLDETELDNATFNGQVKAVETTFTTTTGGISGSLTSSYATEHSLGVLRTFRRKTFGTQAVSQSVHLSASGGIIFQTTNTGYINLPATREGLEYTFIHAGTATHTWYINPTDDDKIMGSCIDSNAITTVVEGATNGAGADGKELQLDAGSGVGDRVTLTGNGTTGWIITNCMGSFAMEA
tara:strand:+ start:827 stop:1474 length:648 start_codon:yes stop_codon:yes gene_type:complete